MRACSFVFLSECLFVCECCVCVLMPIAQHADGIARDTGEMSMIFRYFWQVAFAVIMPLMTCSDALAVHGHKKRLPLFLWSALLVRTLYVYVVSELQMPWIQPVELCVGELCVRLFSMRTCLLFVHAVYAGYRLAWLLRRPNMLLLLHAGVSFSVLPPQQSPAASVPVWIHSCPDVSRGRGPWPES
jgi:hypothetical protein